MAPTCRQNDSKRESYAPPWLLPAHGRLSSTWLQLRTLYPNGPDYWLPTHPHTARPAPCLSMYRVLLHTLTLSLALSHTLTFSLSLPLSLSLSRSLAHTHALSRSLAHTHSLSHAHTHSHTLSLFRTHTHSFSQTRAPQPEAGVETEATRGPSRCRAEQVMSAVERRGYERFPANMAQIRQSRPDTGHDCQAKVKKTC